jgi:hypothetical protein
VTLVPQTLPDYVVRSGEQVYQQPFTASQVTLDGFAVEADRDRLDDLLQRQLVEPAAGHVDYRACHATVVVAMADIRHLASTDAPDAGRGWMTERELSVWCLVADVTAGDRLVWYLPFVFCDSGQTVVTGREIYGYPKQFAWFEDPMPLDLPPGSSTAVQAGTIDVFAPTAQVQRRPVARIARTSAALAAEPPVTSLLDEVEALFPKDLSVSSGIAYSATPAPNVTISNSPAAPGPGSGAPPPQPWQSRPVLHGFGGPGLLGGKPSLVGAMVEDPALVFLKQFRDARCPTKACYQAIVEAPLRVDPVGATYTAYGAGAFTLDLSSYASHPIRSALGLHPTDPIVPTRAFRATFGFQTLTGEEVWRRP